jgi:hypothetical protein
LKILFVKTSDLTLASAAVVVYVGTRTHATGAPVFMHDVRAHQNLISPDRACQQSALARAPAKLSVQEWE